MAIPLRPLLDALFKDNDDWRLIIIKNWPQIMGALHTKVCIEKISEDTIFLGVYDSHWMAELHLLSRLMLKKINAALDRQRINYVRFKLAQKKQFDPLARIEMVKKGSVLDAAQANPVVLNAVQLHALSAIKDPQLQDVLTKFLVRCKGQQCRS